MLIRHHVYSSGKMRHPLIPRDIRDLKVRMKTDGQRHRIFTEIRHSSLHFQNTIGQTVCDYVLVGKRPLCHQVRVFPEFEPAGNVSAALIRRYLRYLPELGIGEQTMNGPLDLNVAEVDVADAQVEPIPLTVGPESRLV